MEKILLINQEKGKWSAHLEITKRKDEFGGVDIKITNKFIPEAPEHLVTLEAHHFEARELILKLIGELLS